jgi:DisA bacterial checkpoint controller nucleotide-binding
MTDEGASRQLFVNAVSHILTDTVATELFDLFNQIVLLPYEEAKSTGVLLLCNEKWPPNGQVIQIRVPFDVQDIRGVRKMLQISDRTLSLLCDGQKVFGFTAEHSADADIITVAFAEHGWQLERGNRLITSIDTAQNNFTPNPLTQSRFLTELQRVFGSLGPSDLAHLWSLVAAAKRQSRGTNVLISKCARAEAARLDSQCTRVAPTRLIPAEMERLTSIDGTVILDTQGVCHAIGAILDGGRSERGDRTRGGRFNSALMYVDSVAFPCVVVVVSQDGMVDLVSQRRQESWQA